MPKYLIASIVATFLACNAPEQDEVPMDITPEEELAPDEKPDPEEVEEVEEVEEEQVAEEVEEIEDADLDEQTYEQDDDDFVPTEEIPVDHPTQFPTNI